MSISDNLGDLLIRIKNAYWAEKKELSCAYSKEKEAVLKVLIKEGKIHNWEIVKEGQKQIFKITLLEEVDNWHAFFNPKRISKPGRRIYCRYQALYPVRGGSGFLLVSTSKGIMDSKEAKAKKLGGELIAEIY
jgi:small subunit ribosomal protein S8